MTGSLPLRRIDRLRRELDALRPLPAETVRSLDAWFDVELTFSSNAIEGNTLSRAETAIVVEKGLTVAGKPLVHHLEAINHMDALTFMRALAERISEPVRLRDAYDIHRLVLARIDDANAGKLRSVPVAIAGSMVKLPAPFELPALMGAFGDWLSAAPDVVEAAIEAHDRLVAIHPFVDGNGRTARLLMNCKLVHGGFPPAIVPVERRAEYIEGLERAQMRSERDPHRVFMLGCVADSLERYLEVARGVRALR